MNKIIKEQLVFLKEFFSEWRSTGTFFPSSRWAAEALTSPLNGRRSAQSILELGPGTGSITVKILSQMLPGDSLTICELNPRFMSALKEMLSGNIDYLRHKDKVYFYQGPAQTVPLELKYDLIVCALPFLNFEIPVIEQIFKRLRDVSKPETSMTYYEYIGLRNLKKLTACRGANHPIRQFEKFFTELHQKHSMTRRKVWLNPLPIYVYTLRGLAR
jgi:phospholipid N-methyltransferase